MNTIQPHFVQDGEGKHLSMMGVSVTFKLESTDAGAPFTLWDYTAPPHFAGPGAHYHKFTDETFYVLEGKPTFYLNDEALHAAPHTFVHIPRGTVHRFSNEADTPIRMLTFRTPTGSEGYFEALMTLLQEKGSQATADELNAVGEAYDTYEATT